MKKLFVPYDLSRKLRDAGFNEPCFAYCAINHKINPSYDFFMVGQRSSLGYTDYYVNYVGVGLSNSEMKRNPIDKSGKCFTVPTYHQVINWFAEKHGLQLFPTYTFYDGFHYGFQWVKSDGEVGEYWRDNGDECKGCDTSEESYIEAIEKSLKKIQSVKTKIKDLNTGDIFEINDHEFTVVAEYADYTGTGKLYLQAHNKSGYEHFDSGELVVNKLKQ